MRDLPSTRPLAIVTLFGALIFASLSVDLRAQAVESATRTLLDKAHALEIRGRMDMAAQTWQQVLLADPSNTEALAGLARSAKLSGNTALANTYLARLRAINPNDPNIGRVESTSTETNQTAQLQQAAKYAQAGQYAQAMKIYRQIFGDAPPRGDWAVAFYETESAIEEDRPNAIAGLRSLVQKYPEDARYSIALGRILTYSPKTRAEGRKLLEQHPNDPQAVEALRQSLTWESNPASAADIRANLSGRTDAQPSQSKPGLQTPTQSAAQSSVPIQPQTQTAAERLRITQEQAAFNALNTKQLDEAERRFKLILASDPKNARALAGMGYVRIQQSKFADAVTFLEQARQNGARDPSLEGALTDAHFGVILDEANAALTENNLPTAEQKYQAALALKPGSPDALEGLGATLLKAQQPKAAIDVYELFTKTKPSAPTAWRGLFLAQAGAGNAPEALSTDRRIPPTVHAELMHDPEYLRALASAYTAVGRDADAQSTLSAALNLPFPPGDHGLQVEIQIQYASLLLQANHLDQAASLYKQILAADVTSTPAWEGLIRVEHAMKQDDHALQTLQTMPPSSYQVAMHDPCFQITVAAIYQSENKLDVAQDILEKAIAEQQSSNKKPSLAVLSQLAGVYVARNTPQRAFPIYQQLLAENPDRPDAWKGLLVVLHATGHNKEAIAQVQQIPQPIRTQLENDVEYLQTMGAIYNALGQPHDALAFINRVQDYYATQRTAAPADIDVKEAWLLFNGGNDTGLYRQLMLLGARQDLTDEQRRSVQTIWINWSVRRANQAAAAGNVSRSLAILNAATRVFPDNPGLIRALAAAYGRAGLPKQAVLIFKAQDMTAGSASDYKAAVSAALATNDGKDAETWLRYGLEAYPKDAGMLTLAARFEESRGNDSRAADYFRASLAAMPAGDPGADLAYELSQPLPVVRLPNAAQDLANLLSTDDAKTARPYLPSYDNINGQPPMQIPADAGTGNGNYSGGSTVVPSYMANPSNRNPQPPPSDTTTLKDYVPQSQNLQHQRLTQQPTGQTLHLTTVSQEEVYGPYVPYVPPQQNTGYTPSPVAIQLGDKSPRTAPAQREVTDVLPTARYMPNAHPNHGGTLHPDFSAPEHQQPASKIAGSMVPPSAPDTTLTLHNAQYTTQSQSQQYDQSFGPLGQQYPQPMRGPSGTGNTSGHATAHRRPAHPAAKAPSTSESTSVSTQTPTQGQATASTSTQAAASATPTLPPLNYPSAGQPGIGPTLPGAEAGQGAPSLPSTSSKPPSDADLLAKSIPPLAGPFDPHAALVPGAPLTPRQKAELELAALEASYSGWIGGTGIARYRYGTPGFTRLNDLEAPFEASALIDKKLRATVVPNPVYLSSGNIDTTFYQSSTGTIPVLGTLPANAIMRPKQQTASGIGGEFQLTTANIGAAVGYTPYGFLVTNITARAQWRLFKNHLTVYGDRDSVKDTQLSYAGLRDPGTASPIYDGNIWGGVIATGGGLRLDLGGERAKLYVSGGGANLTGYHVLENQKYEGTMGATFRVKRWPGYGTLTVGTNFTGMHFNYNERGLTYGQGGYFSPDIYFFAAVPITYTGYHKNNFHYTISGSVGAKTFQEDRAVYYPLDLGLETDSGNAFYPFYMQTSFNYTFNSAASYRVAEHWFIGAYVLANNTYNYNNVAGGFYVRYLFKAQYPTESSPTGLFPTSGFRPIRVP